LFDEFSHSAQVLGRGGNEHLGSAFRRTRSRSAHGIELATAAILFALVSSREAFSTL
jgi:hypothetical protein